MKDRAYAGDASAAGRACSGPAIDVLLRLLAPTLPFATEEVWSWTHEGSVHTASWPTAEEVSAEQPSGLLGLVGDAFVVIRGAKTRGEGVDSAHR